MLIELRKGEIVPPDGLVISVPGFECSPTNCPKNPEQIYIEFYDDKLRIHVWGADDENPKATIELKRIT